jgi:hypothetical protein
LKISTPIREPTRFTSTPQKQSFGQYTAPQPQAPRPQAPPAQQQQQQSYSQFVPQRPAPQAQPQKQTYSAPVIQSYVPPPPPPAPVPQAPTPQSYVPPPPPAPVPQAPTPQSYVPPPPPAPIPQAPITQSYAPAPIPQAPKPQAYTAPAPIPQSQSPTNQQSYGQQFSAQDSRMASFMKEFGGKSDMMINGCPVIQVQPLIQNGAVIETYCRCETGSYGRNCQERIPNPCTPIADSVERFENDQDVYHAASPIFTPDYFVQCGWGIPFLFKCQAPLVWDQENLTCNWSHPTPVIEPPTAPVQSSYGSNSYSSY